MGIIPCYSKIIKSLQIPHWASKRLAEMMTICTAVNMPK